MRYSVHYGGFSVLMGTISLDILISEGTLKNFLNILSAIGSDSSLLPSQAEHQVPFQQKKLSVCLQTVECGIFSSQVYHFLLFKFLMDVAYALNEFLSEERKLGLEDASEESNGVII